MLLTIKLGVPVLLLVPLLLLLLRPQALLNWACLTAGVLLPLSLTFRVQLGIRLILPLVVLALVGLAAAVTEAARSSSLWRRRFLGGVTAAGVAWMLIAVVRVWPNGLSYVNELWGGTKQGYLQVSEANYDWGQGLKELARWQEKRKIDKLGVVYFGTDPSSGALADGGGCCSISQRR